MDDKCIFCFIDPSRIIAENEYAFSVRDGFPVSDLHTLIIPKRHVIEYFDLTSRELEAANSLLKSSSINLTSLDKKITGFNIGVNVGLSAGQTVFHCHIHLIPRRNGDVNDPRGGIRHVIPLKGYYFDSAED